MKEVAEDAFTQSQQNSLENYKNDFYNKWGFAHNLFQLTNNDIRQLDIWYKRPVYEFLNMVVYSIEYNKLQEMEMKSIR